MINKKLYYCHDCNNVFETKNTVNKCEIIGHKKAFITDKQYIDWVTNKKRKMELAKKGD